MNLALSLTAYRSTIAATASPLEYATHIRHINLENWAFLDKSLSFLSTTLPPDLQEYIRKPEFAALCPWDQFLSEYERYHSQQDIRRRVFRVLLHREVTWILANPILEQLQTLVTPVSDINRYLGVVDRLRRLECVRCLLDEIYDCRPAEAPRATEEWSAKAQERKNKSMGSLAQFVEDHTQLFKGKLKIATCQSSSI